MEYTVEPAYDGRLLREILRGPMGLSYSAMKSAKWNGEIRLNGAPAHTDARVRAGDRVLVVMAARMPVYPLKPFDLPLTVAYEDEGLLIVDKPAGLASQSSRNHPDNSLENALFAREGCREDFIFRPVNRLDKGTGGLMAVARNGHVQHLLQRQLHTDNFRRVYLALTEGRPKRMEGTIDLPIAKALGATVRRETRPDGKPSVTHYRVLREEDGQSLLLLRLETGRTHQIRVHLSAIGCPVRGIFSTAGRIRNGFPDVSPCTAPLLSCAIR